MPQYLLNKNNSIDKYTTGFSTLDELCTEGFAPKQISVITALAGMGKCERKGTLIMMYDCSFKKIEDIKIGDFLMGPDSLPRKVLSLNHGFGDIYKIHQNRGNDYYVNKNHILSLRKTGESIRTKIGAKKKSTTAIGWKENGEILNISVEDALKKPNYFFQQYTGYKAIIDFPEKEVSIEPYFIGCWIGDGHSDSTAISNPDIEIRTYLKEYANRLGMLYHEDNIKEKPNCPNCRIKRNNKEKNYIFNKLQKYNLINNKHIPKDYLYNSKELRLQLLAGLIDTDGYMTSKIHEISTKYPKLKDDILFLGRSLGFYCTAKYEKKQIKSTGFEGYYWRIRICGYNDTIPCKVKRKKAEKRLQKYEPIISRIKIKFLGKEEFFGFELDKDGLYLHDDFTVTHNSSFCLSSMKNLANKGIIAAQFALEMNTTPLIHKLLAFNSQLPITKVVSNISELREEEQAFYYAEVKRLEKNYNLFFNDKPSPSLNTIREQIMLLQDHLKTEYIVCFIDLFGKIKEFQSSDNFARDYEKNCNIIQNMTKELGVHMSLVAQIRRDVANRKDTRPTMQDLKNSGALTEISDLIFGIHRPFYNPKTAIKTNVQESVLEQGSFNFDPSDQDASLVAMQDDINKNIAEVIFLKQRMGEGNKLVNFVFDPNTTCFYQILDKEEQKRINASKKDLMED
jgi:replicative DNA helicase